MVYLFDNFIVAQLLQRMVILLFEVIRAWIDDWIALGFSMGTPAYEILSLFTVIWRRWWIRHSIIWFSAIFFWYFANAFIWSYMIKLQVHWWFRLWIMNGSMSIYWGLYLYNSVLLQLLYFIQVCWLSSLNCWRITGDQHYPDEHN